MVLTAVASKDGMKKKDLKICSLFFIIRVIMNRNSHEYPHMNNMKLSSSLMYSPILVL